jgi:uncharacterized protein (DUF4415 family)
MSDSHIRRYSTDELRAMVARGETETDDAALAATTEEEEAAIATDPSWKDVPGDWWQDAVPVNPGPKRLLSLRLDPDVVEWFRAQGPGYQTRMNAVLRAYMKAKRGAGGG